MSQEVSRKIAANPKFQHFVSTRNAYSIIMTILGSIAYYGFILLVAFDKGLLAQRIGDGVTTLGVPIGVGVILFTIVITWIYVRRANSEFDDINAEIIKEAQK